MAPSHGPLSLGRAYELGGTLLALLRQAGARDARIVGEVRRGQEFVSEIEILVRGLSAIGLANALAPVSRGERAKAASGIEHLSLAEGGRLCVRAVADHDWLAELIARTGDTAHVHWLSQCAQAAEWSWRALAAQTQSEAHFYQRLGLPFIPPELRQGAHDEPTNELVTTADLRGTFHCHTSWSDGRAGLIETIRAAAELGFSYIGISDHSRSDTNGLDETRLSAQRVAIVQARQAVPEIAVLHGIEVDILEDGSLDLSDTALAELDFVIASVHAHHTLSMERMTERIVQALSHPLVTFFGHPTGRYVHARREYAGYRFNIDTVCRAAVSNGICFELNSSPQRLDPPGPLLEALAARDARFVINPDAHAPWRLGDTHLGVMLARAAGLRRSQILNAGEPANVMTWLGQRRAKAIARLGLTESVTRSGKPGA